MNKKFISGIILFFVILIILSNCTLALYNPFNESPPAYVNKVLKKDKAQNDIPDDETPDNEIDDKDETQNDVSDDETPDNEIDDKDETQNDVSADETPDNEIDDKDETQNDVSDDETVDNEIDDKDETQNDVSDDETVDNEIDDKDEIQNDVSDDETVDNEIDDKDETQNDVSDDKTPDSEVPHKEDEGEIGTVALTIRSDTMTLVNQKNIILTFSFSEAVEGFDESDIRLEGVALLDFEGDGALYKAEISFLKDGCASVLVDADAAKDAKTGLKACEAALFTITYDGSSPEVIFKAPFAEDSVVGYDHYVFTVDFSEKIEGFELTNINVVNADISNLSVSGTDYSFDVTPVAEGSVSLEIPANSFTDSAGNGNLAGALFNFTHDSTTPDTPTAAIKPNPINCRNAENVLVVFHGEAFNSFNYKISSSAGGTPLTNSSTFDANGNASLTFDFTQLIGGDITIEATQTDKAGNRSSTDNATVLWVAYDATRPQVMLKAPFVESTLVAFNNYIFTLEFSEQVKGFELADIEAVNAQITNLITTGTNYNFTVTPVSTGPVTLEIPENCVTDLAGNSNNIGASFSFTYESPTPPAPTTLINHDPVNSQNVSSVQLTVNGEAGNSLNYTISSSGGGDTIESSSSFDSSGKAILTPDITGMTDGLITIHVTQTDEAGNTGPSDSISVTMNRNIPPAPSLTVTAGKILSQTNTTLALELQGTADYKYYLSITDENDTEVYSETNTLDSSGSIIYGDFDYSSLPQGTLTLSATQSDSYGNTSSPAEDAIIYDSIINNFFVYDEAINQSNQSSITLELGGDPGDSYSYGITSSNGGTPVTGGGIFDASGATIITGLDVSELADGNVTIMVDVTDAVGNLNQVSQIVEKDTSTGPIQYPAWDSNTIYNAGDQVFHSGFNWTANYWTKGNEPGFGNAWILVEDEYAANGYMVWNSTYTYLVNNKVLYDGKHWKAIYTNTNSVPGISTNWELIP